MNLYLFTDDHAMYRGLWRVLVSAESQEKAIEEFKKEYPKADITDFKITGFMTPVESGVVLTDIIYAPEFL